MGLIAGVKVSRQKVVLTRQQMHRVLGLPSDVEVVEMHCYAGEPDAVHIVFEGAGLPVDWRLPPAAGGLITAY